ncbi:hypothetical protein DK389_02815 [Methylobacterium durans]|uniref:Uncharacterized protein n=1 Tax=Methylobacterium durans TaxID=2202825 RepID=A0A2U8W0R1_9HYPH|nr:hypothetical protein DK389_02815 [Methylobacterium durans]
MPSIFAPGTRPLLSNGYETEFSSFVDGFPDRVAPNAILHEVIVSDWECAILSAAVVHVLYQHTLDHELRVP